MNPNENNPFSPAGAGAADSTRSSSIPSPVDFTNIGTSMSGSSVSSGLSMSDSLASAQDSLTSAGQAAHMSSNAVGLDQLGTDSNSGQVLSSNQPLTPADPVPGSIGSVTSVPATHSEPLNSDPLVSAASAASAQPVAPAAANVTTSTSPVFGAGSASMNGASGMGNSNAMGATMASSVNTATSAPAQPYYNPFASTSSMGSGSTGTDTAKTTAPASSATIPPALQPAGEKFSDKLHVPASGKKSSNLMTILGWAMAVVFAVAMVIFIILWQNALANERIIYQPTPAPEDPDTSVVDPGAEESAVKAVSCTQAVGVEGAEPLDGVTDYNRSMGAAYENGALLNMTLTNVYSFTDNDAAEASRGYFDMLNTATSGAMEEMGMGPIETDVLVGDGTVTQTMLVRGDQLAGNNATMFGVAVGEDLEPMTSPEAVKEAYENAGYVCEIER